MNCNIIIFHEDGTPQEEGSEEDMEVQDIISLISPPLHVVSPSWKIIIDWINYGSWQYINHVALDAWCCSCFFSLPPFSLLLNFPLENHWCNITFWSDPPSPPFFSYTFLTPTKEPLPPRGVIMYLNGPLLQPFEWTPGWCIVIHDWLISMKNMRIE